ncbi:MAG: SDR family oxidoreductase [Longimicrobiales bacterium]|nr:SDR family oxidoreductase [Longimicrobiales bacterium]
MSHTPPVALVTGGAVRVGRAISLALAEAGYDLVVHYHASADPARDVRERVEALGRRCVLVSGDLADAAGPDGLADAVREAYDRLDLLVNSAAGFRDTAILDVDAEEWDHVLALNLRAPHLLVRALAPLLRASAGTVVNIADHMGMKPWVRYGHHSVSKAALIHLTRIQARALAPEVRVNAVAPGLVLPPEGLSDAALAREVDATLVKRVGSPRDVAEAVLYLARARYVTGHLLVVDGGGTLLDRPGDGGGR